MTAMGEYVHLYEVAEIIDRTTIAITGPVNNLSEGDDLLVIAVGPPVGNTGTPLVIQKARLEVSLVVGDEYAVCRSPAREVTRTVRAGLGVSALFGDEKVTHRERPNLPVEDKSQRGNPAMTPIRVGDPVLVPSQVSAYALHLKELAEEAAKKAT